jgi:N-acetylated-alpha-linked acidic dipeptidase
VKGAIVHGAVRRLVPWNQADNAAEHGASGCLIYSDPRDDGYLRRASVPRRSDAKQGRRAARERARPAGIVWRSADAGYRVDTWGTTSGPADAPTLTKIPTLPISYGDAQPLLAAMGGRMAPVAWRGALPVTYHLGPGPTQVHLKVAFNWDIKPLYNVVARIQGSTFPDEWIIRGNHHDAWVNGAADPVSGLAPLLEEARAIGQLVTRGWRPKRTLVYAAWDGEEPGLIGSTEWVEHHDAELREKAVLYINSDGNSRGFLQASGSHTLEHVVNEVAKAVTDPETKGSVWKRWQARVICVGQRRPPGGSARASRPADWCAGLRLRLHALPAAPRGGVAQPVVRRFRRRRDLPLDLRRLLSLLEVL